MSGHPWQALGMLAWGTLLIHPADNLIRPLVISNTMQVSFVLVMFGIFGGIAAFGLIGLFIGPVVLAVGSIAWKEWVHSIEIASDPPRPS
jgi:predicted PurR-regulated permease PerM